MVGGTAVAFADAGTDSGAASNSSTKAEKDAPSAKKDAPSAKAGSDSNDSPRRGVRPGPRGKVQSNTVATNDVPSTLGVPDSAPESVSLPDATPVVENNVLKSDVLKNDVVENNKPLPAAVSSPPAARISDPVVNTPDPAPLADTTPSVEVAAPTPAADPAPAAAVAPAASDPAPSMESWLPVTPIVPGAKVKLALQQIEQSKALITEATWGSGNILAGLGSFGPQAALATAQLMLGIWAASITNAQNLVASTVGTPLIHNIAQANLQNELLYPKLAGISLQTASALVTPLGWFGADVAPAKALIGEAQENGKVYAKVPIQMVLGTQPLVKAKINGGSNAKLLLDTGASGLVTTRDKVGAGSLGTPTGWGDSCFSGGICYHYETYNTTVDLGDGAKATVPVNIVTDNEEYPDSVKTFKDFFAWGADGILGVGANTAGPGPAPIPTAAMPGELSDGVLIYQNAYPFGMGGYMILGPNLFPTKVSLPGAPDAYVKVSINGGEKKDGAAIIDSGGVYGTLNRNLYPGPIAPGTTDVPAGAKIDVYTADGTTLLYSYTTQSGEKATPFIDAGLFNTGNAPYAQNPIYLNYGTVPYTGIGSTDFSIY